MDTEINEERGALPNYAAIVQTNNKICTFDLAHGLEINPSTK